MAVAGLHNVSVLNSSLSRESQSPVSRWWADRDRPSTRASSLLQMWRELEVEHVTSHPLVRIGERPTQGRADEFNTGFSSTYLSRGHGHDSVGSLVDANEVESECTISPRGLQNEHEDNKSLSLESIDFSEVERERVREIFREWRNSGRRDNVPNDSQLNNCSRAQWLGEKECERVSVVREWVEKTTQQRGTCHEEQDAEIGAHIERVRDGLAVDHCETRARRTIRRLCGRQALLDLLMRAERERKRELQDLLEHHPVSDFPHRNRIQSLLKARFLRNKAYIQEEMSSTAASELGLLRQRHTVSGLKEGFLSFESDNFVRGPSGIPQSDSSSSDYVSCHINEQTQANSLQQVVLNEFCYHPERTNEETDISVCYTDDSESDVDGGLNLQESAAQVDESHEVLENEDIEQLPSTIECIERRDDNRQDAFGNLWGSSGNDRSREILGIEGSGQGTLLEPHLTFSQGYDPHNDERDVDIDIASGDIDQLEGTTVEDLNWQNMPLQSEEWQESVTESGDMDWALLGNDDYTEWRDDSGEGIDMNSHESSHQWYQVISENDDGEHSRLQVPHDEWRDNTLIEATDNWSDEASGVEVAPADRIDTSYFSDDDNGQSLELRELLSRRRVSNLLRSDFRDSLDQLIQSYVERQGHASADWELDRTSSSPAIVEQDQEQQMGDLHVGESEVVGSTPVILPPPQVTPSQTTWDQDLHDTNWQQPNSPQRFGIEQEWEIINDLRIDMARLHQRMNSMQRMLEACMDMQLELQRSVRQEVSAALNRPSRSEEASKDSLVQDESKWNHVKNGVCCICCDASIDSLLYRCGHMCTCSKCAEKLVQGRDKCPMCRAPVLEVIRAYFVQ